MKNQSRGGAGVSRRRGRRQMDMQSTWRWEKTPRQDCSSLSSSSSSSSLGVAVLLLLSCCASSTWATTLSPTLERWNQELILGGASPSSSGDGNNRTPFYWTNDGSGSASSMDASIQDVTCNVEQLEEANDSQLHVILHELVQTSFFRHFAVDLDQSCPLTSTPETSASKGGSSSSTTTRRKPTKKTPPSFASKKSGSVGGSSGDGKCSSAGLEDWDSSEMPCSVQGMEDDKGDAAPRPEELTQSKQEQEAPQEEEEEEEEEAFECTGGSEELDEDAEPLCSVAASQENDGGASSFLGSPLPLRELQSSALTSITEREGGWESESERRTFEWSQPSDPVQRGTTPSDDCGDEDDDDKTSKKATMDETSETSEATSSSSGRLLPDTFWVDMCSNIKSGQGVKVVNLALNPERNTGYNGTHIWRAIYEENCISGSDGTLREPQCYEERVLFRLLSGLHTSTTLSIAKNYYPPSKRKGRTNWEANPTYFMNKFASHTDHIRNLHFSYVVLLRALRKASSVLYSYDIGTGNPLEDETARILLRRLLDSAILSSCNDVFTAFDESLMFREGSGVESSGEEPSFVASSSSEPKDVVSLKENFKNVFHNVSSILDCVQCQQCKLHGKMAMLGYGTALKILFLEDDEVLASSLSRNEVVALLNTIAKFSTSLREVRELTTLYWASTQQGELRNLQQQQEDKKEEAPVTPSAPGAAVTGNRQDTAQVVDMAVGAISTLTSRGLVGPEREMELVQLALQRDPDLLILAKHYATLDLNKFHLFSQGLVASAAVTPTASVPPPPDAIVVGSGLAGLAASLHILDRGGRVVLLEKEHRLGGNSNKASSGINACCPNNNTAETEDTLESFRRDTTKSAGEAAQSHLIEVLVQESAGAIEWLRTRVGVDLSLLAQLGGHSHKRTLRPSNGMAGAEIVYATQKAVRAYEKKGMIQIMLDTKVTQLLTSESTEDGDVAVVGVQVESTLEPSPTPTELRSPHVILATGGFAADRSPGSYLSRHRPELLKMPATAGEFSTGDGITLATTLGAGTVDMTHVQIHPTGWVDPTDPTNPSKVLAAELMRGIGGILLNAKGERFCNELGTRAYVADKMLSHDELYATTKTWNATSEIPTFSLVLSQSAAELGRKHVDLYTHKGLLKEIHGVAALAEWMGLDKPTVAAALTRYQADSREGADQWGKTTFRGVFDENLETEIFYAGTVTPVLHYCMGGITIDTQGNVLRENGKAIPGLHAAGEVTGGVHGKNRLAGNSLLECTVYGSIVGKSIPIQSTGVAVKTTATAEVPETAALSQDKMKEISLEELQQHDSEEDCWVAIHGSVYDLTDFAEEHPAGAESIFKLAGQDGTEAFAAVHNQAMLEEDFADVRVGSFVA